MPGRKLVLDTPFTGSGQPILPTYDPIESLGSLLLLDATHPSGQWAAGVPLNGAVLPNVLLTRAQALYPAGTSSTLGARVYKGGGSTLSDGTALLERSGKGGLHAAADPNDTTLAALSWAAWVGADVWNYLRANLAHIFYVSLWHRITRAAAPLSGAQVAFGGPTVYARFRNVSTANAASGARPAVNAVGAALRNGAGVTSTTGAVTGDQQSGCLFSGANGGQNENAASANVINKQGSHIFYRAYLEDLTVSGRSYAAVDSIDNALFTKEVLTAGGRYYGDTFTDPVTFFA